MVHRQTAEAIKPPRAVFAHFPFGRPLGMPGDADGQRVVIEDALQVLATATQPGTIVDLPYRWRREDFKMIRSQRQARSA